MANEELLKAISDMMDDKLKAISDTMEERLGLMDTKLESMKCTYDERLAAMSDSFEIKLDSINSRLDVIEFKQDRTAKKLRDLQLDVKLAERDIRKDIHMLNDQMDTIIEILKMNEMVPR